MRKLRRAAEAAVALVEGLAELRAQRIERRGGQRHRPASSGAGVRSPYTSISVSFCARSSARCAVVVLGNAL